VNVVGADEKNQIKNFTPPLPCCIETQSFMHRFLIIPSCPAPLLGWNIMKNLGVVFMVMSHWPGLLMLQKGLKSVHKIPLEVALQVSPSAWYDGISGREKTAIPVKIQLKDPYHYPSCRQYPIKQEV
jgi:hypothetical protein